MVYEYTGYTYSVENADDKYTATLLDDTDVKWQDASLNGIQDKAPRFVIEYVKHKKHIVTQPHMGVIKYDGTWEF